MKRSLFFKSLVALVAAPSVLAKIRIKDASLQSVMVDKSLFKDLPILTPTYYKDYVEKCGNEDFTWWLHNINKSYDPSKAEIWGRSSSEPVTITIKKRKSWLKSE